MGFENIFEAIQKGTVDDVKYFIEEEGVDVNIREKYDDTPLHSATSNEKIDIVKYLISKGADVNAENSEGKTPLHLAASYNRNDDITKFLAAKGAKINAINKLSYTPLHNAAICGNVKVVKALVDLKADVSITDKFDETPLYYAKEKTQFSREKEIGEMMVKYLSGK